MWPNLELASRIADWANTLFICSLIVGVLSTCVIVWMANVKEAHWDDSRRQSNEKIAQLTTDASRLAAETAKANQRTAEAEVRLEELRIQLGRRSFDQRAFLRELKGKPVGIVEIVAVEDDDDSHRLGGSLRGSFVDAGWTVDALKWIKFSEIGKYVEYLHFAQSRGQPQGIISANSPSMSDDDPSRQAIGRALHASITGNGIWSYTSDPGLPMGKFRLIIAPK